MSASSINPDVKRGNLLEIMKYILGIPEPTFIDPFLVCYPKWLSTEKLFDCLEGLSSPTHCGFFPQLGAFLNGWITLHFSSAMTSAGAGKEAQEAIATKILNITNNLSKSGFEEEANRLKLTMIRINTSLSKKKTPMASDSYQKLGEMKGLKLSTLLSRKVAEQLTLLESRMFKAITPSELYSRAWTKDNKEKDAPHITAMINHSTRVSHWVASLILNQKEENNRLRAIQRVISIAQYCLELKNYNAVMEIIGGLSMWPVARILKGMKIPKRFITKIKTFHTLFDAQKNWKNYREAVIKDRDTGSPVLPYLGLFLTDIVFLEEGNPDYCEGAKDVINFEKIVLLGQQLLAVQSFQRLSYSSLVKEKENTVFKYLTTLPFFTEEKLEQLSNDIKPIPEDYKTKELKPSMDWDSAELSTEDDSWSEDNASEQDFEELSTASHTDGEDYREYFFEEK